MQANRHLHPSILRAATKPSPELLGIPAALLPSCSSRTTRGSSRGSGTVQPGTVRGPLGPPAAAPPRCAPPQESVTRVVGRPAQLPCHTPHASAPQQQSLLGISDPGWWGVHRGTGGISEGPKEGDRGQGQGGPDLNPGGAETWAGGYSMGADVHVAGIPWKFLLL